MSTVPPPVSAWLVQVVTTSNVDVPDRPTPTCVAVPDVSIGTADCA